MSSAGIIDGHRLRKALADTGLSQSELARRVGVKQPTITRLINGGQGGSKHVARIAQELKVSPQYLTGLTDDPSVDAAELALDHEEREWIDLLKGLAPNDRQAVLQIARSLSTVSPSARLHDQKPNFGN